MTMLTKQVDKFTEAEIDDEIVVMRLDNGDFFSLSGTAADIWRLIDGSHDRTALLASLAGEYEANESELAGDVDEFLARLSDLGLVCDA